MILEPMSKDETLALSESARDDTVYCRALLRQLGGLLGLELRLFSKDGTIFEVQRRYPHMDTLAQEDVQGFDGWIRLCTPGYPLPLMQAWLQGACTFPGLKSQ